MAKRRLDSVLTERGLCPSRSRAAASVMAGEVRIGADERPAYKPGELVDLQERLYVRAPARFVSRGGIKLANALASTGLDVSGRHLILRPNQPGREFPIIPVENDSKAHAPILGQVVWSWSRFTDAH